MQTQEPVQELDPLAELRAQVLAALDNRPLSPDEPFLGGLAIAQYDALTEQKKNKVRTPQVVAPQAIIR